MTREIRGELTEAKARAATAEWATDPASVVRIRHPGLDADRHTGGVAFVCDRGLVTFFHTGHSVWSLDPGSDSGRLAMIEDLWRQNQHRHRALSMEDLSPVLRVAVAALVAGWDSVAQLPPADRAGIADLARADYVLVILRRTAREATVEAALAAVAAEDWLLALDEDGEGAHACPICGRPAVGRAWHYVTLCDGCHSSPVCIDGRQIRGYNTSMGGGFEAAHEDDDSVCDDVTNRGRVWVDGVECHMGEAKFGGVFVGIAGAES